MVRFTGTRRAQYRLPGCLVCLSNTQDISVTGVYYDSRQVTPGGMFFAIVGERADGHNYIDQAIERGAGVVVHSRRLRGRYREGVCYIRVRGRTGAGGRRGGRRGGRAVRALLSAASDCFFGEPSKRLAVIGVTGTDGKSTVSYLLYQLLKEHSGVKCGLLTTVIHDFGDGLRENTLHQTTPEAPGVHAGLARMADAGCTHAVVELSSHALSLQTARAADIQLRGAILTTLSHEHIDFHKSMRRYCADKARIFRAIAAVPSPSGDSPAPERDGGVFALSGVAAGAGGAAAGRCLRRHFGHLRRRGVPVIEYSTDAPSGGARGRSRGESRGRAAAGVSVSIDACRHTLAGSEFNLTVAGGGQRPGGSGGAMPVSLGLFGRYNIDNFIGALLGAGEITGRKLEEIARAAPQLRSPAGRMELMTGEGDYGFTVFIDFAHTPAAYAALLLAVRELTPRGRLVVVFGCAGERDRQKRAPMGSEVGRWADRIYITDEDPRGEPQEQIAREIIAGIDTPELAHRSRKVVIIHDRATAINAAIKTLRAGDTLLVLGKGHERSIILKDGEIAWDEHAVVRAALKARKPRARK